MQAPKMLPGLDAIRAALETPKVELPDGYDAAPLALLELDLRAARAWFMSYGIRSLGAKHQTANSSQLSPEIVWNYLEPERKLAIAEAIASRRRELASQ